MPPQLSNLIWLLLCACLLISFQHLLQGHHETQAVLNFHVVQGLL